MGHALAKEWLILSLCSNCWAPGQRCWWGNPQNLMFFCMKMFLDSLPCQSSSLHILVLKPWKSLFLGLFLCSNFRYKMEQPLWRLIKLTSGRTILQLYYFKVWGVVFLISFTGLADLKLWELSNVNCRWWWWHGPTGHTEMYQLGLLFKESEHNNWAM